MRNWTNRVILTLAVGVLAMAARASLAQTAPAPTPAPTPETKPAATAAAPTISGQAPASPAGPATPAAAALPTGPQPKVVAVEPVKDVGKVSKGERIVQDFVLRNDGDADLDILSVKPACGCTVADFDKKIAPGKTGKVHAEVETVDFSGPIAKTVTVFTNDTKNPRLVLTVKARVEPHIAVVPGYARYIYVQTLEPGTIAQTLWALDYPDFQVQSVTSPYPFIKASFRESKEEEKRPEGIGRQWRIEATIQGDADVGPLRDFLVVKTNHPKQPEVRVPISGFVRPLMAVTPPVADFGAVNTTEGEQSYAMTLVNFGDDTVEVKSVKADVPGIEATVTATEAGRRFNIKLSLGAKLPKGSVNSVLHIETTSKRRPVIDVPLKGSVS